MKWVRLSKYLELSGDTEDAVHARRRAGIWLDGDHVKMAGDGRLWVNTERVEEWVETSSKESRSGKARRPDKTSAFNQMARKSGGFDSRATDSDRA